MVNASLNFMVKSKSTWNTVHFQLMHQKINVAIGLVLVVSSSSMYLIDFRNHYDLNGCAFAVESVAWNNVSVTDSYAETNLSPIRAWSNCCSLPNNHIAVGCKLYGHDLGDKHLEDHTAFRRQTVRCETVHCAISQMFNL